MSNKYLWALRPLMRRDVRGIIQYARGARWPAWFLLALPFILVCVYVLHAVRKEINWRAAAAMVVVSEIMLMIVEHISVGRGHWVYNENRILGLKIWDVPVEEPLIYYWLPQLFVVATMLLIYRRLRKKPRRRKATQ